MYNDQDQDLQGIVSHLPRACALCIYVVVVVVMVVVGKCQGLAGEACRVVGKSVRV
jgi:hypothetical protein